MNKRNYQEELERVLETNQGEGRVPRLLLHSCCAPCSTYVLEYLSRYFKIVIYFYNPNIYPPREYKKRVEEQEALISLMKLSDRVRLVPGPYDQEDFYFISKGLEKEPEGGKRCLRCYELRLREAAKVASAGKYDYFATTLTISPLKNADKLTEIGERIGEEYKIPYLPTDFKKRNGYKRSVELSREHNLYRQDYCGCVYSKNREKCDKDPGVCLDTTTEL